MALTNVNRVYKKCFANGHVNFVTLAATCTDEVLQAETTNTSPGMLCSNEQMPDMDDSGIELEDKDNPRLSEDELDMLDFAHMRNTYI